MIPSGSKPSRNGVRQPIKCACGRMFIPRTNSASCSVKCRIIRKRKNANEYARKYYQDNKEQIKENVRKYHLANKEQIREKMRKYTAWPTRTKSSNNKKNTAEKPAPSARKEREDNNDLIHRQVLPQ